jgi:EmrB/QacA subfamily drug resistance transporter
MTAPPPAPPQPPLGTTHPLAVASIVATAFFMESFDSTVIVLAIPKMAASFATTPIALSIGLTSYILALAVILPASGWIADRFGARNVFCAAVALFTVSSALCGFAGSLPEFVVWRVFQGIAGALMSPVGRLVVLRSVDRRDLVRAMNFITAPGLIGPLVGPPLGGFIATYADWRWIFFLNIPVGLAGIVLAWRFIPDVREGTRRSFDILGFCLNGIALAALLLGLDLAGQPGSERWIGLALTAFGIAVGAIVTMYYRRAAHPLIDLSVLRIKTFVVATMAGGSFFRIAIAAPIFVLPLFLQVGLGKSAFVSGLLVLAHSIGDLGMKAITTWSLKKMGFRVTLIATASCFGALIGSLAFIDAGTPVVFLLAILFVAGMMRSLQMTALSALQFADVPREQLTSASTYASVNQNVMRALGIALAALLLNLLVSLRGGGSEIASVSDFHVTFIGAGLLALAAAARYFVLPKDAGRHVSQGR